MLRRANGVRSVTQTYGIAGLTARGDRNRGTGFGGSKSNVQTVRVRLLTGDARQAVFAPLDDGAGRIEAVVRRLGSAIALGLIADGDRLPSEQDLATALRVSTMTLRDALAELRDRGLIDTRRGRGGGSFIRAHPVALARLAGDRLREVASADLRELGDLHAGLAGTAARLAAQRASTVELGRLGEVCARLAAGRTGEEQRRIDGRYYIEVAAAAQSVRLAREEIDLQVELGLLGWSAAWSPDTLQRTVSSHLAVVAAIQRRDPEAARAETEAQVGRDTVRLVQAYLVASRPKAVQQVAPGREAL